MRARGTLAGMVAVALLALPFASSGSAADGDGFRISRKIGAGVYYKKIVKPDKKWIIHVVQVSLPQRSTLDVGLAWERLGNVELLSSVAARKGAIAAINGDFGTRDRRPWNMYAEDGNLIQTERSWGRAFAVNGPETHRFIDHPDARVKLFPKEGEPLNIARVNNGAPGSREVALFNRSSRKIEDVPGYACSMRLDKNGKKKFNQYGSVTQRFVVVANRCAGEPMPMYKGVVVTAQRTGKKADEIKSFIKGQNVTLSWNIGGSNKVLDVIGGNPMIVENGKVLWNTVKDCGYLCRLHPRSAVGFTRDDKVLLVVVDGRSEIARGMYLHELARWFVNNGAERAMTFDGGGAAEMWVKGEVVNTPSDGHERPLVNALLVLPGADPGVPPSLSWSAAASDALLAPTPAPMQVSPGAARDAYEAAAADPGSLGGLADFLDRRGADLPPWMDRVARDLRAGQN